MGTVVFGFVGAVAVGVKRRGKVCCVDVSSLDAGGLDAGFWVEVNRVSRSGVDVRRPETWRPKMVDVDRISRGDAASERGVGSRAVPHRLNQEERVQYDIATSKNGFLTVNGSGYRRERKGAPLVNIFRQWCDARAVPSLRVHKNAQGSLDSLVCDFSTLRLCTDDTHLLQIALAAYMISSHGVQPSLSLDEKLDGYPPGALRTMLEGGRIGEETQSWALHAFEQMKARYETDAYKDDLAQWSKRRAIWEIGSSAVAFLMEREDAKSSAKELATLWKVVTPSGKKERRSKQSRKGKKTPPPRRVSDEDDLDDLDGDDLLF